MAILTKRRAKDAPVPAQTGKRTTGQSPSERLTSAIKGEAVATPRLGGRTTVTPARTPVTAKPAISQPGGATSITNRVSGAARPTVSTTQGRGASGSGLTNAITGALSGAAIGVGAKAVYDKLTGTVKKVPADTPAAGGSRSMGTSGSSGTGLKLPSGSTGTSGTGLKLPTGSGTGLKLPGGDGKTPPFAPPGTNTAPKGTGGTKTGTGASGFPISQGRPVKPGTGASGFPVKDSEETSTGASGFPVTTDGEGNTTYTYDDGSTITLDASGNIVSYTEASDPFAAGSTNIAVDDSGNTVYTYDDGSTFTIDADGNVVATTDATSDGTGASDFPVDDTLYGEGGTGASGFPVADSGYYEDNYGNIFDSEGNLVYSADDSYYEDYSDQQIADYIYTDDYGNQYDYYGNLIAEGNYDNDSFNWDEFYAQNQQDDYYPEDEEVAYNDDEYIDYEDDYWGKKGGLVALMKKGGGVQKFEAGGFTYTDEIPADEIVSGTMTGADPVALSDFLRRNNIGQGVRANSSYIRPFGDDSSNTSLLSTTYTGNGLPDMASDVEYFDDGSYIVYYEDGSSVTYDSTGAVYQSNSNNIPGSMADAVVNTSATTPDNTDYNRYSVGNIQYFDDGSYIQTFDDGSTLTVDSEGNVFGSTPATDYSVSGAGSGSGRTEYYREPTAAERARATVDAQKREAGQQSAISDILDKITGSGYLGAGAAGAILGGLLGNTDLFTGGSGTQNQGIDMSKVGVIPARTTDFGVGPANFVTYDQYAARDQMPDIYGEELYRNLNAPGFNPVTEGEYGTETPSPDAAATPGMADGGLAGSYYTFGKAVDPLQNLTNPRPTQAPQMGGLPQAGGLPQTKPQGMPQQPPAMKSGGLPALSNVPLAEGRLDFRQGSAVHGPGDGQSDDIPAMLADGEYVIDAETVAQIGNGSTKAGAKALDEFRQNIRKHKRSASLDKIPPKTKALTSYLKKGK